MVTVLARLAKICQVSGQAGPSRAAGGGMPCCPGQWPGAQCCAACVRCSLASHPTQTAVQVCAATAQLAGTPVQVNVAPAATQLAAGSLSVDAWQQQFSLDAIRNLAVSA